MKSLIKIVIIVSILALLVLLLIYIWPSQPTTLASIPHIDNPEAAKNQKFLFNILQSNLDKHKDLYPNWIMKLDTNDNTKQSIIPGINLILNALNTEMINKIGNVFNYDIVSRILIGRNDGTVIFDNLSDNSNINLRPSVMFVQTNEHQYAYEKKYDYANNKMEYYCAYRVGTLGTNYGTVVFSIIIHPKNSITPVPTQH